MPLDSMTADIVRPLLRGTFGEPWLWHKTCPSTQDELKTPGLPEGAVCVAEHQTAGRGRLGRSWEDTPSLGILVSVLLCPPAGAALPQLSLVAGLAVAETVEEAAGVDASVKWPNDVLVGPRKVAGILLEAHGETVIAGIGVNVGQDASDLPERPRLPATSLRLEAGREVSRAVVLAGLLDRLEARYREWRTGGLAPLLPALEARNGLRGRGARAGGQAGTVAEIALDGRLTLVLPGGGTLLVSSGEVELL